MKNPALCKSGFALLLALAAVSGPRAHGQSSVPNEATWVTDGPVNAIALTADRVILGGAFNRIGAYCGGGVPLSAATGKPAKVHPKINGIVRCCIPDGKGGWYVGGEFDKVGPLPRQNLAHILATGCVDEAFLADANNAVRALARAGSTLYAGGSFTTLGGQPRKCLAAINLLTGAVSGAWDPGASGPVYALAVSGTLVYAGGQFTYIGGQRRDRVAALSTATGAVSAWDAKLNLASGGGVYALAVSGSRVYAGGSFRCGDGEQNLAGFDATSGAATWRPVPIEGTIRCLSLSGSTIYIGGQFRYQDDVSSDIRNHFGALDTATGQFLDAWPDMGAPVDALLASGTKVFVGGEFRMRLASVNIATGEITPWAPNPDGPVYALAASGATVFAGGAIRSINTQSRTGLAALDAVTGEATSWNPALSRNAIVNHLAVVGSTLYVEGAFSSLGWQARNGLGAVDLASGAPTAWNPPQLTSATLGSGTATINALAVAGGRVYVGGNFTRVGGEARKHLVALDAATGAVAGADLGVDNEVRALAASGSTLYAGGAFSAIGCQARGRIAALDAATGAVTAWNPNANGPVFALAADGLQVYAAGGFNAIGGASRTGLAALTAATGLATPWNPRVSDSPSGMALSGSALYVTGPFGTVNGALRTGLAALGRDLPATTLPWAPKVTWPYDIRALAASETAVYVGGAFTSIDGTSRAYFAKFDNPAALGGELWTAYP